MALMMAPPTEEQVARNEKLQEQIRKAKEWFENLSPVDQALHRVDQRNSFAKGNLSLDVEWTETHQKALDSDPATILAAEVRRLRAIIKEPLHGN